jgi:hypothetical protein
MRINYALSILALAFFAMLGCSSNDTTPTIPQALSPENARQSQTSNRELWGLYDVTIDVDKGTIDAVPMRTAMFRCNVNHLMELTGPKHLKFENLGLSSFFTDGRLKIDVGLEHPFPGLDRFTGFDVYGVFMHDGSAILPYDNLAYPLDGTDAVLENPDGYTRWFNMPEFTAPKLVGYTPGLSGTKGFSPTAQLNAYKVFADGLDPAQDFSQFLSIDANFINRCTFLPGSVNYRTYRLKFPMNPGGPVLKFQYAVHANWVPPTVNPPLNIPGDFPIDANISEANTLKITPTEVPWFNDPGNWGGNLKLSIDVYDWQGKFSNSAGIDGEIADVKVAGKSILNTWDGDFTVSGTDPHFSTVEIDIPTSSLNITSADGNECFVMIESANPSSYADDGLIPSGSFPENAKLAAFARVSFATVPATQKTLKLKDVTPPGWPAVLKDVWTVDNLAYAVGYAGGLIIFNIDGPGDPIYVGGYHLEGQGNEVQVEGNYCYIADGSGGLEILDISNPSNPAMAGNFVGTDAQGVYVLDGYCYLADGKGGLQIIDVGGGTQGGSPTNPKLEGNYKVTYAALDVVVNKGIAYVTDYETAFLTIDVGGGTQGGSPSSPKLEGTLPDVKTGNAIALNGSYVYVADNTGIFHSIVTIDVSVPSTPNLKGSESVSSSVWDLWLDGSHLYAAADMQGLLIYNISPSDPPIPLALSSFDTDGNSMGVSVAGTFAYIADQALGLVKIDISDPGKPVENGKYFTPHDPYDLYIDSGYIYAADGGTGMEVMDIGGGSGTPTQPLGVGAWHSNHDARGVWVENGLAYLGGGWFDKHFEVIDVSTPSNPVGLSDIMTSSFQGTLAVQKMGSYVYATGWEDGLKVFDVDGGAQGGSPSNPKYITNYATHTSWGLDAKDGYVYLADGDNLEARFYVFDVGGGGVGSPTSPVIADSVITPVHQYDVQLDSGYAYVSGGDGLRVFDVGASVGAPNNIVQVGAYNLAYPILTRGLGLDSGYAFLVCSTGEMFAVDIGGGQAGGSPTNPQLVDTITMPGDAFDVTIYGDYAYVVMHHGGLRIVQIWE